MRLYGRSIKQNVQTESINEIPKKTSLHSYFPTLSIDSSVLHNDNKKIMKSKSMQLYFQKEENTFHECSQCGMTFQPFIDQDRIQHEKFHSKHLLIAIKWNESNIQNQFDYNIPSISQACTIYYYSSASLPSRKKQTLLNEILSRIDEDMESTTLKISKHMLFFVMSIQYVVSIFVCEHINSEYGMQLGILRMWTRQDMRRKGIASFLLNKILNILNISSNRLAFSAPTFQGIEFAKAFLKVTDNNLVPVYSVM